ncbi:MAG: hypothetical protein QOG01_3483 [Pseudonocardiales bacterium]|jgi:hypothetical protein|nr:hypothetical protein [Pseudonocardiales bacterium]
MYSGSAVRSLTDPRLYGADVVTSVDRLRREGWTPSAVRSQIVARRWQRIGRAVVRHNGPLSADELNRVALIVLGPRALLTSFTALGARGLLGWERGEIHTLVPRGARVRRPDGLPLRIHYTDRWTELSDASRGDLDSVAHAALLAAASFEGVRPACAVLAATVQQRLLSATSLTAAVRNDVRVRHHRDLLAAARDIGQGAEALSEIDFARLCRRYGLPQPTRQALRPMPGGRRRYLDAEWKRRDGRRVVAEVDGALHLIVQRWWDDQLRQNELAIADDIVLRFPTVVVRAESAKVANQLRRALLL